MKNIDVLVAAVVNNFELGKRTKQYNHALDELVDYCDVEEVEFPFDEIIDMLPEEISAEAEIQLIDDAGCFSGYSAF